MVHDISRRTMLEAGAAGVLAALGRRRNAPRRDGTPKDAAPAEVPANPFARLEESIASALAASKVPGLSIAVIRYGGVEYAQGFGAADVAAGRAMTPATVFPVASLTKPVFAFAALKLCVSERLALDTPLAAYLSPAKISREAKVQRVTPRMVLSHTTGLPNWVSGKRPYKFAFDPGARFGYSGEAYNWLHEVAEKVSAKKLDALLAETVVGPFELNETGFIWTDAYADSVATGYNWDVAPVQDQIKPATASAAGSMHTTARDYAKFMTASLGGIQRSDVHLDYATERMMLAPQVRLDNSLAWGLGWGLQLSDAGDIHWHFADGPGHMCYAALRRSTGDGIVIFTNGRHGLRVCHAVAAEVLAEQDPIFTWIYDVYYEGKLPQWPA